MVSIDRILNLLPLRVRVDLGVIAMKGYSTFLKASELKSHYRIV